MKCLAILYIVFIECLYGFVIPDDGIRYLRRIYLNNSKRSSSDQVETMDRRSLLLCGLTAAALPFASPVSPAQAFVGNLPEFQDTNAVLKGITVKVTDPTQLKQMISFLQICFDFKVLRSTADGSDVWMGFGPEQMSIPAEFRLPVSSFQDYGGHASIHIRYDSQATFSYYRGDGVALGDNVAYVQGEQRLARLVFNILVLKGFNYIFIQM